MLLTIIALTIVFLSIIINKFIVDPQLQYIYWLVVFLLFVSVSNIYMTMHYYVKLRNEPGIKGERGDPGEKGQGGSTGVCEINTGCGAIQNCRDLIEEEGGRLDVELQNGEISIFGENSIEVISVVGHTDGNAVYLVNDILIMGDSAQARKDSALEPVAEKYSDNPNLAARSLEELGAVLEPRKNDITWTVFSHSGPLKGINALLEYRSE